MKRVIGSLVAFAFLAGAVPVAVDAADEKEALKIMAKMDDINTNYDDQEFVMTMKLYSGKKLDKTIELKTQEKGGEKRLIRILKPGDVKGLSVLVEDADTMYVYMPQFKRTRRVAAHTNKQSFLGSDFTEQEMAIIRYDEKFNPSMIEKTDKETLLRLIPKDEKEFEFKYIKMWIDNETHFANKLEYYGADDFKLKTQTRSGVTKINGILTQTKVVMEDHRKKHSTEMIITDVKENQGLSDRLFTRRNLEWGR